MRRYLSRLSHEPLLHFLAGGLILYATYNAIGGGGSERREIVVTRAALLNELQFRARAFKPEYFAAQLDAMSRPEFDALVHSYVEQEVMYRQALLDGLEEGDDVIRQRLIQKTQFLLDSESDQATRPQDFRRYYDEHRSRYASQPTLTFSHVFFSSGTDGDRAAALAREAVATLNRRHAGFNDAPAYGEKFPFLVNYVDRPVDFVASQFGETMADQLLHAPLSRSRWQGPFRSAYGWHAVLIVARKPAATLPYDAVASEVHDDYLLDRQTRLRGKALDQLRAAYRVHLKVTPPPMGNH